MTPEYERARRIALGLSRAQSRPEVTGSIWDVAPKEEKETLLETPFQFFAREMEAPPEMLAQRAALSLFDEYEGDQAEAMAALRRLEVLLRNRDADGVKEMLTKLPLWEWLSFVFLEDRDLNDRLIARLEATDDACRQAVCGAVRSALKKIETFQDLFTHLHQRFGGSQ